MNEEITKQDEALTASEIRAQVNRLQEGLQAVMKKDVHYGTIPGCGDKPALFKPGAEKILSTFRIAIEPIVTDLSTTDESHYRIETRATSMVSGSYLGSGIGEASSNEEKYRWRKAVCDEEFDATPEDRRRIKWSKGQQKAYQTKQVRTNSADIANTVLKMAKKRALVDACLTMTAASDCFTQDIEDMPAELAANIGGEQKPSIKQPQRKLKPAPTEKSGLNTSPMTNRISEPQRKRLWAISKSANVSEDTIRDYLKANYKLEHTAEIQRKDYDGIIQWLENGGDTGPEE